MPDAELTNDPCNRTQQRSPTHQRKLQERQHPRRDGSVLLTRRCSVTVYSSVQARKYAMWHDAQRPTNVRGSTALKLTRFHCIQRQLCTTNFRRPWLLKRGFPHSHRRHEVSGPEIALMLACMCRGRDRQDWDACMCRTITTSSKATRGCRATMRRSGPSRSPTVNLAGPPQPQAQVSLACNR